MSVSLLTSLALALGWTTNLGTFLIRRGRKRPKPPAQTRHMRLGMNPPCFHEEEQLKRMMAAEEASLEGGWFGSIIRFYERWLRRALEHPVWLGGFCLILIAVSYLCFNAAGQ